MRHHDHFHGVFHGGAVFIPIGFSLKKPASRGVGFFYAGCYNGILNTCGMDKTWVVLEPASPEFYEQFPQLEPAVADLLYRRGIRTQEAIDEFLNPDYGQDQHDPFLFREMKTAVQRILDAISRQETITIHGDYDADGLSGAVILHTTIEYLGGQHINVYLPDREREGYGLNENTVRYLYTGGTKLIITCDCGISNAEEIDQARGLGMDVIVTDHHAQKNRLPNAILLHPKVDGETYPFKDLAGGGVAFKLAQGLLRTAAQGADVDTKARHEAFEKWLLDMVAISSVADMVPLVGENRTLVKYGLTVLSKARRPGLRAVLSKAGLWPLKRGKEAVMTTTDIGFVIAPRLNAAGRVEHANTAFAAVMAKDPAQAAVLAEKLEETNKLRQQMTEKILAEAKQQIGQVDKSEPRVLVAYDPSWSIGVAGLIASRLMDQYHLPVFVLGQINGQIAGSGRSADGFDCTQALDATKDLYAKYGGHKNACGLTLAGNEKLEEFKRRMNEYAKETMKPEHIVPKMHIDAEVPVSRIQWGFFDVLSRFEPFGMGNAQPKFVSRNVEVVEVAGVGADKSHLRLVLTHDHKLYRKAIAFRKGEWASRLKPGHKIDVVYHVEVNEWNGNRELQLHVLDLRLSL